MINSKVFIAAIFSAILFMAGSAGYKILADKAIIQHDVIDAISRWKQSYTVLANNTESWQKTYPSWKNIPDFYTLIGTIKFDEYHMTADTDSFVINSVDPVLLKDIDIGLSRVCFGGANGDVLVSAPTFTMLLQGIQQISARQDISIGSISILGGKGFPQAKFGQFCMYLRSR